MRFMIVKCVDLRDFMYQLGCIGIQAHLPSNSKISCQVFLPAIWMNSVVFLLNPFIKTRKSVLKSIDQVPFLLSK